MTVSAQEIESGHTDVVHDVQMDYYGKRLATCSSDRTIKVFAVTGDHHSFLADLSGHEGPVWQVAWAHPKYGSVLASCSYDRRVIIWKETAENQWIQAQVFHEHESSINSISWAPHEYGLCLACASSDGSISVLTARSDGAWDTVKISQAHPVGVTSVSWAPATAPGSLGMDLQSPTPKLVSGGCDNTVKVWKLAEGQWRMDCFPPLTRHTDWVRDVAWAPNLGLPKSTIASASQSVGGECWSYELEEWRKLWPRVFVGAATWKDGTVVIWTQAREGDPWIPLVLCDLKVPVWRLSWSLTGNILAASDGNNNVSLWKEAVDGEWAQLTTLQ